MSLRSSAGARAFAMASNAAAASARRNMAARSSSILPAAISRRLVHSEAQTLPHPEFGSDAAKREAQAISDREKYLTPSLGTFQAFDEPLVLDHAKMQYMWDVRGRKFIDLLGQNLSISVGHCHPTVTKAAIDQMQRLPHCTTMYHHEQPGALARELVARLPAHPSGQDWVVHLVNTGSEAVDLAVQMARTFTGRAEIVAMHRAYHGLQGYAAALTAIGKATQPAYSAMFTGCSHVPPGNLEILDQHLQFATGGHVAGFIAEPVQGYGGIFPLPKGYLSNAFALIRKRGGIAISDEVQTGYGRLGENFWGFQDSNHVGDGESPEGSIPDMITTAKGMGNGVGLIAAVIVRRDIAEAFATKMWFNTYGSNPVASAAARAVLQVIEKDDIMGNCTRMGQLFNKELTALCKEMPTVYKEVRGKGLFQGLEVAGQTPEASGKQAYDLHRRLLKHGVVVGRGSAAGNVFRIQPPMCIQEQDVRTVVRAIKDVGEEWLSETGNR